MFDVPEPVLIDHYVQSTLAELKKKGFTGDNVFLAAHSLGGVMSQIYSEGRTDIKGQILMGSVLLRDKRSLTDEGKTEFKAGVPPTLTLVGEKDGLLRVTRGAESYWHQTKNIVDSQAKKFPVVALEGMSHASFMDSSMLPSAVKDSDLKPEVDETTAHAAIAEEMAGFFAQVLKNEERSYDSTEALFKPMLAGLELEGSYALKPACYNKKLLNPDDPKCSKGSPWSEHAQKTMAGDLASLNADITTVDNFHQVYTVTPVHLPEIDNKCDGKTKCTLKTISVTENFYNRLDQFDTGKYPIAADEMKAKLMSRQSVQTAAGNANPDFHTLDEEGNRCADINKEALQWALDYASPKALERYNKFGKKLVIGDDEGPFNAGPLWIWRYLSYADNKDKTETLVQAPMMRTPTDYPVSAARGFHYCKLLSPFRALEWIYIDSLYDRDGIKTADLEEEKFFVY